MMVRWGATLPLDWDGTDSTAERGTVERSNLRKPTGECSILVPGEPWCGRLAGRRDFLFICSALCERWRGIRDVQLPASDARIGARVGGALHG